MKKLLLTLSLCVFTSTLVQAGRVYADGYVFQKQLVARGKDYEQQCQTFRIHKNWFLTAAHCVKKCQQDSACQVKILSVREPANTVITVDRRDIFVPKQYRPVETVPSNTIPKSWDVALIHYQPTEEEAEELTLPVLYRYSASKMTELNLAENNLLVPLWENGRMQLFSNSKTVLYFGEKQSMWSSCGFGLNPGNSGGAVTLKNGGVIGIVLSTGSPGLAGEELNEFPCFQTQESFLFNGFAPKTTLKFIEKTMGRFGDYLVTEELGV